MSARLKYRWFALSLIWALVLGLTGWNIHRIDQIQMVRQDLETMQMDLRFLKARQATIQEIRMQESRLTHVVTSDDLGFLVVENNLKQLSWKFGLQNLSVKTDANALVSNVMPINTVVHGTVPSVAGWLSAVEEAYPYLVIKRMDLAYEPATRTGRLQATFDYHLTLSDTEPVS
jgi:hypothetical protein